MKSSFLTIVIGLVLPFAANAGLFEYKCISSDGNGKITATMSLRVSEWSGEAYGYVSREESPIEKVGGAYDLYYDPQGPYVKYGANLIIDKGLTKDGSTKGYAHVKDTKEGGSYQLKFSCAL